MGRISARDLAEAGCNAELIERCEQSLASGNTEDCVRLLRAHRCSLVDAMHEAQRPIDVCDWLIREVEIQHA